MRNKIEDLRNHLFEQLEKLKDAETTEDIQKEIDRSKAIVEISQVLVDSAKAEVDFLKVTGSEVIPTDFFKQGGKLLNP